MRKLMALAIVLVVTGFSRVYAVVGLENLSYDGSLEFGGYSADNEVDQEDGVVPSDHRGEVVTRQRLGINGDVTDSVRFRLEFGRNSGQFGKSVSGASAASSSLQDEQDQIKIQNAYIDFANFYGGVSARLGRQYIGNPGDLVWNFAPTDDNNMTFNAIDGLLLQHRAAFVQTDLFLGKMAEDDGRGVANSTNTTSDVNLNSLDFVFPTLLPGAKVNLGYVWGVQESSNSSRNNKLSTYRVGVNGGVMDNRLTYRAEYFMNDGENKATMVKYEGSAIDLGVGYNMPETAVGGFGFNLNWLQGSGDDKADSKDKSFRDFSALNFNSSDRLMGEIFGKSNTLSTSIKSPAGQGLDTGDQGLGLEVLNLGVFYTPKFCPRSTINLNWYTFDTAKSASNGVDSYGDEIDLVWNFRHSDNINASLGYAMLSPDNAIVGVAPSPGAPAPKDDDVTELFTRLSIKWGSSANMSQIDSAK